MRSGGLKVPAELHPILHKALAPEAAQRFPDAQTFLRALETVLNRDETEQTLAETLAVSVSEFHPVQAKQAQPTGISGDTFGWTPELLHKLEVELVSYVGPVAEFLIRKHSAGSQSPMQLVDSLARHINNADERSRFLSKAKHCMETGSCHDRSPSLSGKSTASGDNVPLVDTLTPEQTNRLVQTLAGHVGPFARQLVTHHAQKTYSLSDFYTHLASSIPNLEERRRFLDEITR